MEYKMCSKCPLFSRSYACSWKRNYQTAPLMNLWSMQCTHQQDNVEVNSESVLWQWRLSMRSKCHSNTVSLVRIKAMWNLASLQLGHSVLHCWQVLPNIFPKHKMLNLVSSLRIMYVTEPYRVGQSVPSAVYLHINFKDDLYQYCMFEQNVTSVN